MTLIDSNTTSTWKYRDTFPNIPRAGKLIPVGNRAKDCLQEIPRPSTPPVVKKILNTTRPEPGAIRVFYGKANDPDIARSIAHGINTKTSLSGGRLLNPPQKTLYQQKLLQLSEAVYASSQKAPLGRSHDQSFGLPHWYTDKTTFGVKTVRGVGAAGAVNPPKTTDQLEEEVQQGHQAYIRSHNAYFVGERIDRKYCWSHYGRDSRFGVPTPHHNDGRRTAKTLRWLYDTPKAADPLNVPTDHTFGILLPSDEFGAGDLIYSVEPGQYQKGQDRRRGLVNAVRQHLKKVNFQNFASLLQAFRHYDKSGKGVIDKEDLRDVCRQLQLDLSGQVLDDLMDYCDQDKDGLINFLEFSNFLNWKDKMPISVTEQHIMTKRNTSTAPANMRRKHLSDSVEPTESEALLKPEELEPVEVGRLLKTPRTLSLPEELEPVEVGRSLKTPRTLSRPSTVPDRFVTSSSLIRSVVGGPPMTDYHTYGVPTVRTDLPAPRLKRICDNSNYGDQATAAELLSPTLHSIQGIQEKHFFGPRTKYEIAEIFRNVGVNICEEMFEEAWKLASMKHPTGQVCVETFRNILKEVKAM